MSVELLKPILMIPGPMDVPDEVLWRLSHQVFPHYDSATRFPQFYNELTDKVKKVFGLENGRVFIPSGSGTLAVNMALASLCTPADEVLIISNGTLGEYAEKNLKCLGVPFTFVNDTWGKAINPGKVRDAMKKKRYPFIYMTHNESSTSVVNPIPPIGEIAREFDSLLIVDSISGVGGVVVQMEEKGADVVAGASQKCLELPPGLSPVAVGERAWRYMDAMKNRRVPFYLDFQSWKNAAIEQHDFHPQPVTGNTSFLYALDWSVDQILKEGVYNRQERYRAAGNRLREGFAKLGFRMSADPHDASPVVTDFYTPEGIFGEEFRAFCMEKHNIMIGQGFAYKDKEGRSLTFRIAHFGLAANPERIEKMIEIAGQFMKNR